MAKVSFTAGKIKSFSCPADREQAFLWDSTAPGLGLRITPAGKPTYIFQSIYSGKTVRIAIGSPEAWPIPQAQAKARELQRLIDQGTDPREQKRQALAESAANRQRQELEMITVADAWSEYVTARSPKWSKHHQSDHERLSRPAGFDRFGKPTIAGPLNYFMGKRLAELSPGLVQQWAEREGRERGTVARLCWRLLRAFLGWCTEHNEYKALLSENPASTKATREALGTANAKDDALEKSQLRAFFSAVQKISNTTISAYIQALLLTGARPGELLALKWDDINETWGSITLRDKDESKGGKDGTRTIPLTPYVLHLLAGLPRRSQWVFSSSTKNQPIASPHKALRTANKVAGVGSLSFHGLRRSFGSLSEWLEIPAGVIAQLQGHKPSATAEKHYRVRPLDLLRVHHERFEAWILEQAGVSIRREN